MAGRQLRILHAIHDFLPRHQAGAEIYVDALCRRLAGDHHVTVLAAEYDPGRPHGCVSWRLHRGLPVAEVVNNWAFDGIADSYRAPSLVPALDHVLRAVGPDVVHVHTLLNLSFELPALARARGAAVVATLHDYTFVCPSGGQRVDRSERHVCHEIDPQRCARCFGESSWAAQMTAARWMPGPRAGGVALGAVRALRAQVPGAASRLVSQAARTLPSPPVDAAAITARLAAARDVLAGLDLVVAPSAALAREYARFGLPLERTVVADYGFEPIHATRGPRAEGPLRIGFVGTLTWHKGVHVLLDAVRDLPRNSYEVRVAGDLAVFPDYSAALGEAARDLPVIFTGRFEREGAAAVYGALDVLVVPSLWPENSPLVIHEAFMMGVPVVGARIGGIPDLVEDGVSGLLVDPASPATLTAALRRLIDEPDLLERLRAGRPAVRSLDEDAAWWTDRYRALAAGRRRRPA